MPRATLIVTGGAGFIGANFARYALRETKDRVVVVDKLSYAGHLASLAELQEHPRFLFVRADIADSRTMAAVFSKLQPRAVVNLAAESHVDRSIDGPRAFVRTNLTGTFEFLEATRRFLAEASRPCREAFRFLHVSTDEVYGTLSATGSFAESAPYAPNSPYAATKAGADHLARAYFETFGVPTIITNCSNNYGPFQYPEKLIPLVVRNALEGASLPIYGDGKNVRDWLHVEDHCAALLLVLKTGRAGQRYNIGASNERDNESIVDATCAILEKLFPSRSNASLAAKGASSYQALKRFVPDRPGHDRRYAVDASKIRGELGWRPSRDFDDGLADTVAWYIAHRGWCEAVERRRYPRGRLGLLVPAKESA